MKPVAVLYGNAARLSPYLEAVRTAGLEPSGNPEGLDGMEGLLLTGGSDVNPLQYGEAAGEHTDAPDNIRDERELRFLHEALRLNLPVLAICRGMQLLNVACGGSLVQHIENGAHDCKGLADAHEVRVENGSALADILGVREFSVNSRHHQAVARVGTGLRVSARSADDTVEALENPSRHFVIGVQWHPEDRVTTHDGDRRLFEAFARAIAQNRR